MLIFPSVILGIGEQGRQVLLRLKGKLLSRHPELLRVFRLLLITDRPWQRVNEREVPNCIPCPRLEEGEVFCVEAPPAEVTRREMAERFAGRLEDLKDALERNLTAIRDPVAHLLLGAEGFQVGFQEYIPVRLFLFGALTERMGNAAVFPTARLLRDWMDRDARPNSALLGVLSLAELEDGVTLEPAAQSSRKLPVNEANVYAALKEWLLYQRSSGSPLFDRSFWVDADMRNGARLSRCEDFAEAVSTFLYTLLLSELWSDETLRALVFQRPEDPSACSTFGVNSLMLPRDEIRISASLNLGANMANNILHAPKPSQQTLDNWIDAFLRQRFDLQTVGERFRQLRDSISDGEYLPEIRWAHVERGR